MARASSSRPLPWRNGPRSPAQHGQEPPRHLRPRASPGCRAPAPACRSDVLPSARAWMTGYFGGASFFSRSSSARIALTAFSASPSSIRSNALSSFVATVLLSCFASARTKSVIVFSLALSAAWALSYALDPRLRGGGHLDVVRAGENALEGVVVGGAGSGRTCGRGSGRRRRSGRGSRGTGCRCGRRTGRAACRRRSRPGPQAKKPRAARRSSRPDSGPSIRSPAICSRTNRS